jgi:hypothetical protein
MQQNYLPGVTVAAQIAIGETGPLSAAMSLGILIDRSKQAELLWQKRYENRGWIAECRTIPFIF